MDSEFFDRIANGQASIEGPKYATQKRHWGCSVVLDANTVINSLNDGEPSAHFHRMRTEEYVLYSGEMAVYRAENIDNDIERTIANLVPTMFRPGDRVVIVPNIVHIPLNMGKDPVMFIEISHGPYLENDIQRIYDKSGRDIELAKRWADLGYAKNIGIKDLIIQAKDNIKR